LASFTNRPNSCCRGDELGVELLDAALAVVLHHHHRQEEAEDEHADRDERVDEQVAEPAQHDHRRDVEHQHLAGVDEQEHVAQVVHRLDDVAFLVLLVRLAEHTHHDEREEERATTQQETGDCFEHGVVAPSPAVTSVTRAARRPWRWSPTSHG
jgi:hypothetical protein